MPRDPSYDRETALQAAMNLFWVKGYNATSLKDLESALHMRPGSIYAAGRMDEELAAAIAQAESPLAALRGYLVSLGGLEPCEKPSTACMLVKSLLEIQTDNPVLRGAVLAHLEKVRQHLTQAFARAQAAGEIPVDADPDRLAQRMQTYVFGLKIQAQRETDPVAMQRLADDLADEIAGLSRAA
jgi:AcrR family transcriptional regulator